MKTVQAAPLRIVKRRLPSAVVLRETPSSDPITMRTATVDEADAIDRLIAAHLDEGHLLPRNRHEILVHIQRFVVAVHGDRVIGCGELAPLSRSVAEVRSLVVISEARSTGVGQRMIDELLRRAARGGFDKLCAFTHSPGYFTRMGFSIVPHVWLPEKIVTDCHTCRHFRKCGQYAVIRSLAADLPQARAVVQHG